MQGLNIWQILWESGLVVKLVLLLLVLSSVLSWTIIWQKYKELKTLTEANDKFNDFFRKSNSITDIHKEASENTESTMSLMFKKGFDELNKTLAAVGRGNLAGHFSTYGFQSIERALKAAYNTANERMDLRVSLLATIGSITPFIGLFGTVWGIIDAFSGLSQGGGSIEAVAPGIAEALVATAVGLAAAIPAVVFYNLFNNQISRINSQMESFSQEFLNLVERTVLVKKDQ
jgi:biopolymer transport protein TolQ